MIKRSLVSSYLGMETNQLTLTHSHSQTKEKPTSESVMEKGSFFFLDIQPTFHMDLHSYIGHDPIKLKNVLIFEFGPNVEFANEALKDKSDFISKNCTLENRKK